MPRDGLDEPVKIARLNVTQRSAGMNELFSSRTTSPTRMFCQVRSVNVPVSGSKTWARRALSSRSDCRRFWMGNSVRPCKLGQTIVPNLPVSP